MRCGYADFAVDEGSMTVRKFAFAHHGHAGRRRGQSRSRGRIARSAAASAAERQEPGCPLRSPLRSGGSFKDPSIRPQGGPLALRGAAAAVLYSIAPPAILLALLETGPAKTPTVDAERYRPEPPSTEAKRKTQ